MPEIRTGTLGASLRDRDPSGAPSVPGPSTQKLEHPVLPGGTARKIPLDTVKALRCQQ